MGYSLTGTVDQGYSGEGLTSTFRELKPGMVDAVFDGLAPLRWCLFAEPVNVCRGAQVELEAVLANEDVLLPGDYPVRIEVFGPGGGRVFVRETSFTVEKPENVPEPPFVLPVFCEKVRVDWAGGEYRLTATLLRGGAAAGREARFRVFDPADMPHPDCAVTLWGDDPGLAEWLRARGIACRGWSELGETGPALILAGAAPPAPGGAEAFGKLMTRVERGAAVVFLSPSVFADGEKASAWVPAADPGTFIHLPGGVYHKDDWAKPDPVFHGLPTGVLDYGTYREVVNTLVWTGSDTDADIIAGAIQAAPAYGAGTSLTRHRRGDGLFYINTLRIREVLESDPVAELLLRNLLMDAIRRL